MKAGSFYKSPSPGISSPRRFTSPSRLSSPRFLTRSICHRKLSPSQPRARSPNNRSPIRALSPLHPYTSPFNRITSKAQIQQLVLPGFLRVTLSELKRYSSLDQICKNAISDSTINDSHISNRFKNSILEQSRNQICETNDISQIVFDRNLPDDETLINIGRLSLSREDLLCMQLEQDLNEAVVDVVLKLIKRKNKKLANKGKVKKKIYCLSTKFCKNLFQSSAQKLVKHNKKLLDFDFLIFPCKFGYWTLVVFDTMKKVARFYDPIGICNNKAAVQEQLKVFIKHELSTNEYEGQGAHWSRIDLEKVNENEVYPYFDCGIYIIRQAHRFAVQENRSVHPELLPNYRKKILNYMFKHTI